MNEKQLLLECSKYLLEDEFIITHVLCKLDFKSSLLDENLFILTNKSVIYTTYEKSISLNRLFYDEIKQIDITLGLLEGSLIIRTNLNNYVFTNISKDTLKYIEERLKEFNSYVTNYGELIFDEIIDNIEYINNNTSLKVIGLNNNRVLKTNTNTNTNTNQNFNPTNQPKNKKKTIFIIIIVVILLSMIFGDKEDTPKVEDNTPTKQEETIDKDNKPDTNSKEEAKISQKEVLNTVLNKIKTDFDGYGIVTGELVEEDGIKLYLITVNPTTNFTETIYLDKVKNNGDLWKKFVKAIENSSAYCKVYLDESGYSDINVGISILNDANKDKVILTLVNGETLYDVADTL